MATDNKTAPETSDFYCDFVLSNKIQTTKECETESVLAYRHTKPSWSIHIVAIPKYHVSNLTEVTDPTLISEIFNVLKELIIRYNFNNSNYKIVSNGGSFQDSKHLHFHLLSGEKL